MMTRKRGFKYSPKVRFDTNGDFLKLLRKRNPNMVINICDIECSVAVNPEIYDEEDSVRINRIIRTLAKDIWIDRTYVSYRGNRFKDAFILESGWKKMMKLLLSTDFGRSGSKEDNAKVTAFLTTIAEIYLYSMAEKYGFSSDDIEIRFENDSNFYSCYFVDDRKEWKM